MFEFGICVRCSIRLLLSIIIVLNAFVVSASAPEVSIKCPCLLERVNQTKADLLFGLIFNKEIDQSGELNVKLRISDRIAA